MCSRASGFNAENLNATCDAETGVIEACDPTLDRAPDTLCVIDGCILHYCSPESLRSHMPTRAEAVIAAADFVKHIRSVIARRKVNSATIPEGAAQKRGALQAPLFSLIKPPLLFTRPWPVWLLCHEGLTELESGQHNPPNVRGLIA